jgi:hypothetical protein
MKLNTTEKEVLREEFKQNNFLGSEEYTEAVVNYWLSKIDSILEKKEKDIVEMLKAHYDEIKHEEVGTGQDRTGELIGISYCIGLINKLNNK